MNELVKLVAKKTGMSESVAQIAVTTVISAVKTKLPANVGGILDTFLEMDGSSKPTKGKSTKNNNPLGDIGNVIGGLSGLLGKK